MKRINVLIALLLLTPELFAQNENFNFFGAGARASGMGSAFIGLADDATAITWNPAGLVQLNRTEVSSVAKMTSSVFTRSYPFNAQYDVESKNNYLSYSFGSIVLPIKLNEFKLSFGVCYQTVMSDNYEINRPLVSSEFSKKENMATVSPAIAVAISGMISIGFTTNIWTGNYRTIFTLSSDTKTNATNSVAGKNFVIGTMFDLSAYTVPLKIGVTIKTPFELSLDLTSTTVDAVTGAKNTSEYINKIGIPLMIGVGMSYRITDELLVAVDYEQRAYADKKVTTVQNGQTIGESDISVSHSNIKQIRAGAEYTIVTPSAVFPIRIGYRNDPTNDASGSQVNGITTADKQEIGDVMSVGGGASFSNFSIDMAYERSVSKNRFRNYDYSEFSLDYTTTYNQLLFSVILYF